jgi:hypothetical protein
MPAKINMFLSNGNSIPQMRAQINAASLSGISSSGQSYAVKTAPSALSAPIISRIHSVRPGCGSCGRH